MTTPAAGWNLEKWFTYPVTALLRVENHCACAWLG